MRKIFCVLAFASVLLIPSIVLGQAVLLSGPKGASTSIFVTASSVDADTNALDVNIAAGSSSGTEITEDVASSNPIVGTATLIERDDQLSGVTPIEGDNIGLRGTDQGALWVAIADSSGDPITSFGGGTQHNEDDMAANLDTGTLALYLRDDTPSASSAANNDYEPARLDGFGTLYSTLTDAAGGSISAASLAVTGSGVLASTIRVNIATDDPVNDAAVETSAAINASRMDVTLEATADITLQIADSDASGGSGVNGAQVLRVTIATDDEINDDLDSIRIATQLIDNPVFVDDAAFTLTTSSVMVTGGIRDDTLSTLSAVEGDAVPLRVSSTGALHVTGASGATEFAEDTQHSTGAAGVIAMAVRNDTLAELALTDGDYSVLQVDADGALYVNVARGGGQVEDTVVGSADSGMPAFFIHDPTPVASTPNAAGDYSIAAVDGFQSQYVTLTDAAGAAVDASSISDWFVDPCQREAKSYFVVDVVNTTLVDIASAVASEHVYICAINLVTNAANNVAIVEDTTTLCASPTAGLTGGTTAAEGWNFAANGGLTLGNGSSTVMRTATVNHFVCLAASASTQLSGHVAYVQAP